MCDARMKDFEALLGLVKRRGFRMHAFDANRHGPGILAGDYRHSAGDAIDVIVLYDQRSAAAWRAPIGEKDEFAPSQVYWSLRGDSVSTLRALLLLPPPGMPEAPNELSEAPAGLGVPAQGRKPCRVWPAMHRG